MILSVLNIGVCVMGALSFFLLAGDDDYAKKHGRPFGCVLILIGTALLGVAGWNLIEAAR